MILAGDIGGTKTNLGLYKWENKTLCVIAQHQFASQEYASFMDVVEAFEALTHIDKLDALCLGIAGPIIEGNCQTTNLPWEIKSQALQHHFNNVPVRLLNDLEATAYGMLYLDEKEFVSLNPQAKQVKGNHAVIAAGTGLGEAILYFDGAAYQPIGSEGGHTDFAPLTPQQDALLAWFRKQFPEHVSYERILSGPGVTSLYEFLKESDFAPEPSALKTAQKGSDKSALISECALNLKDPLCVETLRLFTEIYAAEAGNLALKSMALGGVFIGGGIAPKILPFMKSEQFMSSFIKKGRFETLLKNMPVKIACNSETALLGAAHFAVDNLVVL